MKSKTTTTWLAVLAGAVGAHRFYLKGWRDPWGWLHLPLTLLGLWGVRRVEVLGQDDRLSWLLLPLLGMSLTAAMLSAIIHGLTSDEQWNAHHNRGGASMPPSGWLAVLGVVAALLVGATVLVSTIAFSVQRAIELQVEAARHGAES